jgi:hypothetical protein
MFCLWVRGRRGGAAHIYLAHSLNELMIVCIFVCASIHFLGFRGMISCSSLCKLLDVDEIYFIEFSKESLDVSFRYGIYELSACVDW